MKGFIEIKEDSYEDTLEHLRKIKTLACKLLKMLASESSNYDEDDDDDYENRNRRRSRNRYEY